MTQAWLRNPAREPGWRSPPAPAEVRAFHRGLPGYAPTRLVELPDVAAALGVGRVFAKDESDRFGLPAFKALGASWAVHRALREPASREPRVVITATDGNHGRAVARFARLLGHRAVIVVPDGVHPSAVQAIRDEGADVRHRPGGYDDAVATAAALADDVPGGLLVQDMAWAGYEQVPGWIVDGYTTLFAEADEQLADAGVARPRLVVVPTGVGSLLQAALTHWRSGEAMPAAGDPTAVVSVEPDAAACVLASVRAGRPVSVPTRVTTMAGLNCGTLSSLAWPAIRAALDGCVAVTDRQAADAARSLARAGVAAGPCGAASLAGARVVLTGGGGAARRTALGIGPDATVLLLITEGERREPGVNAP